MYLYCKRQQKQLYDIVESCCANFKRCEQINQGIFTGLYGWNCLRQVYKAHEQSRDDPVQQQCSRYFEEWQLLSPLQNWGYEVRPVCDCCNCKGSILLINDRPTHLLESHVSGHLLTKENTEEGEVRKKSHSKKSYNIII